MRIGIDATNIRAGGGLTHLSEMLNAARPEEHGVDRVVVWGGKPTLERLPERGWLEAETLAEPPGRMPGKLLWQQQQLSKVAGDRCDLLFVPGGTYTGSFRPFVAMSQNLLPFEPAERARFGLSWPGIRYRMLERSQTATFRRAAGVIFLTETARRIVTTRTGPLPGRTAVVPLGIADRFSRAPRGRREFTREQPFRWLYVSIVNLYKHPWHVVDAAARLRSAGTPLALDLVGPAHPPALARLERAIASADPDGAFVRYRGAIPYASLADAYHGADGFVFASSCENMPNILVEAMASGLPIACSNRGPMPEVLGDAGVYFDPEEPRQIADSMARLMDDHELREACARRAHERARIYSWERCAEETFAFLSEVGRADISSRGSRRQRPGSSTARLGPPEAERAAACILRKPDVVREATFARRPLRGVRAAIPVLFAIVLAWIVTTPGLAAVDVPSIGQSCSGFSIPDGAECCGSGVWCDAGYECAGDGCCPEASPASCGDGCMPTGGDCCDDGSWCEPGFACAADGCCPADRPFLSAAEDCTASVD